MPIENGKIKIERIDLPPEIDGYIKETIDDCLGLPVSSRTLEIKLRVSQETQQRLHQQQLLLLDRLKEKDELIERARAEATMNAQALKRFVEENQILAAECANLSNQCDKWERECSLYDHDREALMDFGNEADERAKEAELRANELEEEMGKLLKELEYYKQEHNTRLLTASSCSEDMSIEEKLLDSVLDTVIGKDVSSAQAFLEAHRGQEAFSKLLEMWSSLKPSTRKAVSLVAEVKALEKDKEHLRINLNRAEEEVKLLFEENRILDEENKRVLRQYQKARSNPDSNGKHSASASAKSNKRKSSPKTCSPIDKKLDFNDMDSARQPLSPLRCNSSDSEMHKR